MINRRETVKGRLASVAREGITIHNQSLSLRESGGRVKSTGWAEGRPRATAEVWGDNSTYPRDLSV